MVILGKAVHRDILYCAAGPNEFVEKHVVPGVCGKGGASILWRIVERVVVEKVELWRSSWCQVCVAKESSRAC